MDKFRESTIKGALSILYDINHTINLIESIGICLEWNIGNSNIGGNLYEVSTEAYCIVENTIQEEFKSIEGVSVAIQTLYIEDDSKNNKIKECYDALMRIGGQ